MNMIYPFVAHSSGSGCDSGWQGCVTGGGWILCEIHFTKTTSKYIFFYMYLKNISLL